VLSAMRNTSSRLSGKRFDAGQRFACPSTITALPRKAVADRNPGRREALINRADPTKATQIASEVHH
jgi:hypothetical protein